MINKKIEIFTITFHWDYGHRYFEWILLSVITNKSRMFRDAGKSGDPALGLVSTLKSDTGESGNPVLGLVSVLKSDAIYRERYLRFLPNSYTI